MTIFYYKRLTRNPEIRYIPVWVLPDTWRLGRVRDIKFDMNVPNKMLLNAGSSNVNGVIRATLNLFFFFQKDFTRTSTKMPLSKSTKRTKTLRQKYKNTNKGISDFFPLRLSSCTFFIFAHLQHFVLLVHVKFLQKHLKVN